MTTSRLRWQCRRGMRELDELLTDYLDTRFERAAPAEQRAFRELLALADHRLIDYLLGGESAADPNLAHVIREIRMRPLRRSAP
jgi:antitoxin CptB